MNPTLQWEVLHWAALHGGNPTHSRLLTELCCGRTHLSGARWGWLKDACLHLRRESGIHWQDDEVWHLWTQGLHPLVQNLTGCVDLFLTRQKQQHVPWNSQVALSLFIRAGLTHHPSLLDPAKTAACPLKQPVTLSFFTHTGLTHHPSLPDPSKTAVCPLKQPVTLSLFTHAGLTQHPPLLDPSKTA